MTKFFTRLTEPSTHAGLGAIASGIGFLGLGQIEVGISAILTGLIGVVKKEKK